MGCHGGEDDIQQFLLAGSLFCGEGHDDAVLSQFQGLADALDVGLDLALFQFVQLVGHHDHGTAGILEPLGHGAVIGGGLVPGSLTLISGEPGIGKSTIIIQAAANIASGQGSVLYVSGEESEEQKGSRVC